MGIKFGEIDASQILENEFRISVLELLLEWILNNNSGLLKPGPETLEQIRREVITRLQKKYPNSGITYKGGVS